MTTFFSKPALLLGIIISSSGCFQTKAQQPDAGIYFFQIKMDEEVATSYSVEDKTRNFLNGYGEGLAIEDRYLDSIVLATQKNLGALLNVQVEILSEKRSAGISFSTTDFLTQFAMWTFPYAKKKSPGKKYYIYEYMEISGERAIVSADLPGLTHKIKPRVDLWIKVFDKDKNKVYDEHVTLKDWGKLKEKTHEEGGVTVKEREILNSEDVFTMYVAALNEVNSRPFTNQ
jgi:hypothetical protein